MTAAKKRFMIFGFMAMAMILVAILAPILATHDPNSSVLADAVQSPSKEHWFGTDKMGRDLFSRVIYGTRTSILSTMVLVLSILFVGGVLGAVGMNIMPDFPAADYINAVAVGAVSGLAATGVNQVYKQAKK